jgi:DNA-binding MarR family transcriptional regulator
MKFLTFSELSILLMIIVAGLLGGLINYFLGMEKNNDVSESENSPKVKNKNDSEGIIPLLRSLVIGIGASLLVPLFLATISSGLIQSLLDSTRSTSASADAFVFFGFCLIGAISSRLFIQTLSDKILKEVKEAKKEAKQATNEVRDLKIEAEPILQQNTEPDDILNNQSNMRTLTELPDKEMTVLSALINSKYVLRTAKGISQQSGMDTSTVAQHLKILTNKALVNRINGSKGERWAISSSGQKLVQEIESQKLKTE